MTRQLCCSERDISRFHCYVVNNSLSFIDTALCVMALSWKWVTFMLFPVALRKGGASPVFMSASKPISRNQEEGVSWQNHSYYETVGVHFNSIWPCQGHHTPAWRHSAAGPKQVLHKDPPSNYFQWQHTMWWPLERLQLHTMTAKSHHDENAAQRTKSDHTEGEKSHTSSLRGARGCVWGRSLSYGACPKTEHTAQGHGGLHFRYRKAFQGKHFFRVTRTALMNFH